MVNGPGVLSGLSTVDPNPRVRTQEVFTPGPIMDAVRVALDGIELDVASCAAANETVKADRYYTVDDDALAQDWTARTVWCNPPFRLGGLRKFSRRLLAELNAGNIDRAGFLGPLVGGSTWPDEMSAAADHMVLLRQHLPWHGPECVSVGTTTMAIWLFAPITVPTPWPLASAIYHREWGRPTEPRLW